MLKAYHLRKEDSEDEKIVEKWEQFVEDKDLSLKELFDKHLFRMRRWSRGETGLTNKRYGSYLRFTEDFLPDKSIYSLVTNVAISKFISIRNRGFLYITKRP